MIIEVRSYKLKPGTRSRLDTLFVERALPMLHRWDVDVVAHGPSLHDDCSYYLMRSYRDLAHRQQSQDAFYGSDEWRSGPRAAILECIDDYTDVVIELADSQLAAFRSALAKQIRHG